MLAERGEITMEHKSDLTGEYEEIRKLAEQIAKDRIAPGASERDLNHTFPSDCIRILGETGFLGLIVSEDLGGFGVGRKFFASAIEEISMACASTALVLVSYAIVAKALELAADEAVAKLFAPRGRR
jgi:alkylation response protein AidB-like acyl-CoA dehydrogenase